MTSHYEVRPCRHRDGLEVEECPPGHIPEFWGVYLRTTTADWVADFLHEDDACDFAEMRNRQ